MNSEVLCEKSLFVKRTALSLLDGHLLFRKHILFTVFDLKKTKRKAFFPLAFLQEV